MNTRLTLIHAVTPLHAGTGHAVGAIDLPIARERPTGIPLLPGSSLKGALRARSEGEHKLALFGPETTNASDHAGAVQFADAHLLLLPVRSLWGTFAWVTSPYLVQRFLRDLREAGVQLVAPVAPDLGTCHLPATSALTGSTPAKVVLEDLDFTTARDSALDALATHLDDWLGDSAATQVGKRLCLVHDDVMSILMDTATEVCARIRLKEDTKTVADGALWYEEALPSESVLFGLVVATGAPPRDHHRAYTGTEFLDHLRRDFDGKLLQLGGKATIGRGMCRMYFVGGAA